MNRIKHPPAALFGLFTLLAVTLAAPLPTAGAAQKEKGPRQFYLTKTLYDGSQALTACAAGYHMASLWEIFDPSNLRYNTELGLTQADSGSGPPTVLGWIRTGSTSNGGVAGAANCRAWTSAAATDYGTAVSLSEVLLTTVERPINPWYPVAEICIITTPVWCVQD